MSGDVLTEEEKTEEDKKLNKNKQKTNRKNTLHGHFQLHRPGQNFLFSISQKSS